MLRKNELSFLDTMSEILYIRVEIDFPLGPLLFLKAREKRQPNLVKNKNTTNTNYSNTRIINIKIPLFVGHIPLEGLVECHG